MSEYQYYEFRTIDQPLTEDEQQEIGKLSSRVDLSPTHARFVYNYSDFPGNAEEILARYFDAMFYIANWGSCQLMFRFPKNLVDLAQMQAYCLPAIVEEFVSVTEKGDYVVLNIHWHEEAPDWGWIEGQGWLPRLLGLRDDILRGDYRLLYLAWLKAITLEPYEYYDDDSYDDDDELTTSLEAVTEPPVPPGLRKLSSSLLAFVELFELDEQLIAAAAEASGSPETISEAELRQVIAQLSREQCDAWLLRLAQGEAHLGMAFNRTLLEKMDRPATASFTPRTVGDLLATSEQLQKEAQAKQAAAARARHIKKMEDLATRETQIWQDVMNLIETKTSKAYDQAVAHLADLRDLARHQGEEATFQARLNRIYLDYRRLSALLRRLRNAKLYET